MKFVPRKCAYCNRPKGTVAFRYFDERGRGIRDYFHPGCFSLFQVGSEKADD